MQQDTDPQRSIKFFNSTSEKNGILLAQVNIQAQNLIRMYVMEH